MASRITTLRRREVAASRRTPATQGVWASTTGLRQITPFEEMPAHRIATACLLTLTLSACSGPEAVRTSDVVAMSELEALYWAKKEYAQTLYTEADVRFMTGMIPHHAQALVISRLAPTHGASDQLQTLTARIINAQMDEIATMQKWLRDRDEPVPEFEIDGLTLTIHGGGDHAMHMPGMLTQDQIVELDQARGPSFDRLFLTYMIQHHRGAVSMVDDLFEAGGGNRDDLAFRLASDINVDQITEIARMERMLDSMRSDS